MSKRLKAVELFLAVGLAASTTACAGASMLNVDVDEVPNTTYTAAYIEGGEGGEGLDYATGEQANADFEDQLSGAELLSALREGGHVIYFRHAQTAIDHADQADLDMSLDDCETQPKLNNMGEKQAQIIGTAFVEQEIPVGEVVTSEYCQAWKTAEIAFGEYTKNPQLNSLPFEDNTDEWVEEVRAKVMPLLTAVPSAGENTVLVGHDDIFKAATGLYFAPLGIAYVLTPDGNGEFILQATMLPQEWAQLSSQNGQS